MRNNNGNQVKRVTLIIPESVDVMDITYYWKTSTGRALKTMTAIMDCELCDKNEIECYNFPEEEVKDEHT